jgi:hypothetical protein
VPPRGVTKVERLNRVRTTQASPFVVTPEWGRSVGRPVQEQSVVGQPRAIQPRLEARRKAKEEARQHEETQHQETLSLPTLPTGQPPIRGVNIILTVLAMLGCLHVVVMLGIELNRMVATQQEITRLTLETQVLEGEVAGLQSVLESGDTPKFREQLARRAGFAYPDEARWLSLPGTNPNQP